MSSAPSLRIALVATANAPEAEAAARLNDARSLSTKLGRVELIVWPESTLLDSLEPGQGYSWIVRDLQAPVLTGAVVQFAERKNSAAALLSPEGSLVYAAEKHELVPAVESELLELGEGLGQFRTGSKGSAPFSFHGRSIQTLVCYDALFGTRYASRPGSLLVVLNNGDWLGPRLESYYADAVRIHALAAGIPAVLVGNNAYTAVFEPGAKRILARPGTAAVFIEEL